MKSFWRFLFAILLPRFGDHNHSWRLPDAWKVCRRFRSNQRGNESDDVWRKRPRLHRLPFPIFVKRGLTQ